ncbi:hypothetical protein [Thalassococcus sp. S3]|uniref:hypothetical protein n=1 Tax=Thalassococcus sp. S3 TaxID=2017482 RepID=UPI00102B68FB|nr:hypothetical protein [Thalassococcus sp. S3]
MKILHAFAILTSALALSACSSSSSSSGPGYGALTPDSNLVTLRSDGSIPDQGFSGSGTSTEGGILVTENGVTSGFSYQTGRIAGTTRYLGVAGIAPDTQVGPAPTAATATYTGDYQLSHVTAALADNQKGRITLNADFNAGTLTGQSGGLDVAGTINGSSVGGTASYGGVTGNMQGLIGRDRTVTAFAGHSQNNGVLVGGIIADAP